MSLVVYGDFVSLECYLASHRVDALTAAGVEVDWRAIESDPHLLVSGRPLDSREIEMQMRRITRLLLADETLPWSPPAIVPNTEAAVSGYAEACSAGVGADVRRLLFAAYWVDGVDIGNADQLWPRLAGAIMRGRSASWPLHEYGYAIAVNGGPITTAACRRIDEWRTEWRSLSTPSLPALVVDGGLPVTGETALRRLEKELIRRKIAVNPELPDPANYPSVSVRPHPTWVSQTGGRWANVWKTSS